MGAWLDLAEFLERCPEARAIAGRRLATIGLEDGPLDDADAAIDDLLEQAIVDAESRIRTRLLKRFSLAQMPTTPSQSTDTLKRLTADYSWWQLHRKFEIVSESVERLGAAVMAELQDLVAGGKVELVRVGPVASPGPRTYARSSKRSRRAIPPLTLDEMADWGP